MTRLPAPTKARGAWRSRAVLTYQTVRAHPTGGVAVRMLVAVVGGVVVLVGLFLVPLPGPGWLIVLLGVSIWAVEFVWARRLLGYARHKLRGWTDWISRRPPAVKLLVGAFGLLLLGALAVLTLRFSLGIDLLAAGRASMLG